MRILLYAGPAPWRDQVLQYSQQFIQQVAASLTLVTGGAPNTRGLLDDALARLSPPPSLPVEQLALPGSAQKAIFQAAAARLYDLVILGRLQQPLTRLIRGPQSKVIVQRLELSVLRVHGRVGPIRRVLIASGGDRNTLEIARVVADLARPLNAMVTILHVISQQSLFFERRPAENDFVEGFLQSSAPEAEVLREAAAFLTARRVPAQLKCRSGLVLDEVLAESHSHDLLVIGAHQARSTLDRILLEDISGDLLDLSPLPVLLVKRA